MTVALDVYEPDGVTLVDRLETARGIRWLDDLTSAGMLGFTISAGDESSSLLVQEDRIVKVTVNGTVVFAGYVATQRKHRVDNDRAVVQVGCVGLRGLLEAAKVFPEGGLVDGVPRARVRLFGWPAAEGIFDSSAWALTASHGPWSSNPFGALDPPRQPQLWPPDAASAELIWATHTGIDAITGLGTVEPGKVYFRRLFTTDEPHDVVWVGSANDEVVWYLDGQEIQRAVGAYQWSEFASTPLRLDAGDHVLAAVGTNLERPVAVGGPDSGAWILGALLLADPDGQPAQTDETWQVHRNGATGGTFRLKFDGLPSTGAIAWNASAANVKTAIDDTHPSLDVTVTGTGSAGDPWVVVADGPEQAGQPHKLEAGTSALTGGASSTPVITNTVDGAYAPLLLKTDTTWRHLPYPASTPGVNFGIVLGRLFDEVAARGDTLDALSVTWDDDLDSSGAAWSTVVNLPVSVGTDMESVVAIAEDAGLTFHVGPDGAVGLWDVGNLGDDRTGAVELEYLGNVSAVVHDRDGRRYDRLLIETEGGFYQEAQTPGSPAKEGFLSAGGFAGSDDFAVFSAQALADYATQPDRTTATFPHVTEWEFDLWLDAADLTSAGALALWSDKSGNGRHFTQATASFRPTVNLTELNGMPGVVFDGVNDLLQHGVNLYDTGSPEYTMLFVVRHNAPTDNGGILAVCDNTSGPASNDKGWHVGIQTNDTYRFVCQSGGAAGDANEADVQSDVLVDPDLPTVLHVQRTASNVVRIGVLGEWFAEDTSAGYTPSGKSRTMLGFFRTLGDPNFLRGVIYEVMVVTRVLADAELDMLVADLRNKWGI